MLSGPFTSWVRSRRSWTDEVVVLIDFDEEIKKFYPSLEVEKVEEAVYDQYNQHLVDVSDIFIKMIQDSKDD